MIGENIKKLREARGATQKELAETLGFSYQNISKWENDINMPDIPTVLTLAKYFGVSTDTLLGNAPEKASLSFTAVINEMDDKNKNVLSVWTAFEHLGKIAPPAHQNEGRYRTSESATHRASSYKLAAAIGVNAEGKICSIFIDGYCWLYHDFYWRTGEKNSCIKPHIWNEPNWSKNKRYEIMVPKDGFLILVPLKEYKLKQIFEFILPEESFAAFSAMYMQNYPQGVGYFLSMLANGELDGIDVKLDGEEVVFSKESDFVNPLYDNIDHLTELVRARVEKTFNQMKSEIKKLREELDEVRGIAEDAASTAEDAASTADEALEKAEDALEKSEDDGE